MQCCNYTFWNIISVVCVACYLCLVLYIFPHNVSSSTCQNELWMCHHHEPFLNGCIFFPGNRVITKYNFAPFQQKKNLSAKTLSYSSMFRNPKGISEACWRFPQRIKGGGGIATLEKAVQNGSKKMWSLARAGSNL